MAESTVMEQIVSLCKRRGFVYPASEIYGGLNGFWDYGPLGVLLKNNIRDWWWHNMVLCPPVGPDGHPLDIVGLDSAIIQNPKTWIASGHVAGFNDPMVDDVDTKQRFRADHLYGVYVFDRDFSGGDLPSEATDASEIAPGSIAATVIAGTEGEALQSVLAVGKKLPLTSATKGRLKGIEVGPSDDVILVFASGRREYASISRVEIVDSAKSEPLMASEDRNTDVPSPYTGRLNVLTAPRQFNLMFPTSVGALQDESSKAFLRPETAQGIFLNYKNVVDTTRVKVPFGVAQVGKSFRNEVTPRNFIFRSREFEQMEIEWFCHPDEAQKWFDFWKEERMKWWRSLGVSEGNLRFRQHDPDELSHYAKAGVGTADIEYRYPFTAPDFGELEGIAHRTDFDLRAHEQHSKQRLDYFDQDLQVQLKNQGVDAEEIKRRSRYYPHVIEPASGLTRAVLVLLCDAYTIDATRPSGMYMKFSPRFAPIKCGIYPLVNKDGMPEVAERLYLDLRKHFTCEYDPKQAIGKRYARNDEIGTPFCLTIDGQTLTDDTVTVRERDTMRQERVAMDKVKAYLLERLHGSA